LGLRIISLAENLQHPIGCTPLGIISTKVKKFRPV
jgi:hypothetical protein